MMKHTSHTAKRLLASALIATMLTGILPAAGAMAAEKEGTAAVSFGDNKAYDVTAKVNVNGNKITSVTLDHNAKASGHADSAPYADKAKAMAENFTGVSATDADAIAAVDGISGATVTSDAYRNAVSNALNLQAPTQSSSHTFGSAQTPLAPGTYKVPISLKKVSAHKPYKDVSAASAAFPATATLTVTKDGKATITSSFQPVTIGPIVDMAYDIKVYQEDGCQTGMPQETVKVLESTVKPTPMPGAGKTVPTKIAFQVPDNSWDGVYLSFKVDAMGSPDNPGTPDAWLQIDYSQAKEPGVVQHKYGQAKVNQFGKYTIYTDVTVTDGVITNVAIEGKDFISPTHQATNQMKIDQVTSALQHNWDGMAPTPENAEKIFKKIMKAEAPDEVIDGVSGATYSAKAVRDAVMQACELQYQDEIINVPESVEPGTYEVDVEYASDVVWHSLLENQRAKAILTVNEDRSMRLDMDLKSGTSKEPLYILGFNGVYPNNDREANLTMEDCKIEKGLSSNDYADENFAKGTQVVTHVSFPLLGGLQKTYNTNAYLYVPAMKRLNGDLSGVHFENGKFNVDVFAKIYWDDMKKIENTPAQPSSFTDVPVDAWYAPAVNYVNKKGIMSGIGNGKFAPSNNTTRAMIVTTLYKLEGQPAITAKNGFSDVANGQWYTNAITWAADNNIVSGIGNSKFAPNQEISREQLVTILYRYAGSSKVEGSLDKYSDASKVSSYAQDAMLWAVENGIVSGMGNNTLAPQGQATRAQVAQIMMNFCDFII